MKRYSHAAVCFFIAAIIAASMIFTSPANAAGVVGNGNPASCTESALSTALAGGGLVTFNCGPNPKQIILTGQRAIHGNTTIDGGDLITLSGGHTNRLFSVFEGASLSLMNIHLYDGYGESGGAIFNAGTLELRDVSVGYSAAAIGYPGGGISNTGVMTVTNSIISENTASGGGGGIYNTGHLTLEKSIMNYNVGSIGGGAIVNSNGATLIDTTFEGNSAGVGGGIANTGVLTLRQTSIVGNTATSSYGGGIYNYGTLYIFTSNFNGNSVPNGQRGGGIYNDGSGTTYIWESEFINNAAVGGFGGAIDNHGKLGVYASTLVSNTASSGMGGAIYTDSTFAIEIRNSTLVSNNGGYSGGGLKADGDAIFNNSTIAGNTPDGVANEASIVAIDYTILANNGSANCQGTVNSAGQNLDSGNTCLLTGSGDLINTDPMLGPLADNGGPTRTMALLPGSPAIDAGLSAGCTLTDQRGMPRPLFGICDIGAYEYGWVTYLPITQR